MAIYAIGDIQGCFVELKQLLEKIRFSSDRDQLWFTGDLVNRGPQSLQVLRFVKSLGENAITVLGNHDLHMLAVVFGLEKPRKKDTLEDIIAAPDKNELIRWICQSPLLHVDHNISAILVHAGIYPQWTIAQAIQYANEVEQILQSDKLIPFLQNMYGNLPATWSDELESWERLRFITNVFTRMRFCTQNCELELTNKGSPQQASPDLIPWYRMQNKIEEGYTILFGHWSTLAGLTEQENVIALDTGCLWGGKLTAVKITEDMQLFQINCKGEQVPVTRAN